MSINLPASLTGDQGRAVRLLHATTASRSAALVRGPGLRSTSGTAAAPASRTRTCSPPMTW